MFSILAQAVALAAAVLTYTPETQSFKATFAPGAIWACVSYTSQTQTIEQGGKQIPYAPSKCGLIAPEATSLVETWANVNCTYTEIGNGQKLCPSGDVYKVKVTIQYPKYPANSDGSVNITSVETNTVTASH